MVGAYSVQPREIMRPWSRRGCLYQGKGNLWVTRPIPLRSLLTVGNFACTFCWARLHGIWQSKVSIGHLHRPGSSGVLIWAIWNLPTEQRYKDLSKIQRKYPWRVLKFADVNVFILLSLAKYRISQQLFLVDARHQSASGTARRSLFSFTVDMGSYIYFKANASWWDHG